MNTWVFLRHGESTANRARQLSGWEDVALTALGRAQARDAGRALWAEGLCFDRVLSSDLVRAHDTATLALEAYVAHGGGPPPPRFSISWQVASSFERVRPSAAIRAPWFARANAMPWPTPCPAPVTTATLSSTGWS